MHRRANGLLDPDRRDLAWSICRSVTSVVGLRSRLLCFALLARGRRFKSCPRYEFQARNLRIPSLKAFTNLIECPLRAGLSGLSRTNAVQRDDWDDAIS